MSRRSRGGFGLVADFSAAESAILGYHDQPPAARGWRLDHRAIVRSCRAKMAAFDVRPSTPRGQNWLIVGRKSAKIWCWPAQIGRRPRSPPDRRADDRASMIGAVAAIQARLAGPEQTAARRSCSSPATSTRFGHGRPHSGDERGTDRRRTRRGFRHRRPARPADGRSRSASMTVTISQRQRWVSSPLLDVVAGLVVSGLVLLVIGVNPIAAFGSLLHGAFGYPEAIGYTALLYDDLHFRGPARLGWRSKSASSTSAAKARSIWAAWARAWSASRSTAPPAVS